MFLELRKRGNIVARAILFEYSAQIIHNKADFDKSTKIVNSKKPNVSD